MKDYYLPDSWYEPDCDYEPECNACDHKEKIMDVARDYLKSIIEMLYGDGKLDVAQLDDHLGELCHQFDMQVPAHLPHVVRKDALSHWVEFNNKYLKKLA